MVEIHYIDDPDPPRKVHSAPSTKAPTPHARHSPPVSQGTAEGSWFICYNEGCTRYGHVATGKNTPTHHVRRGRCGDCKGVGINVEADGDICEPCGGSGRKILKEWDEVDPILCPYCHAPMEELDSEESPHRFPRMSTPHHEQEGEMPGQVGFGRTRKIE